jgi:hypothetical protein
MKHLYFASFADLLLYYDFDNMTESKVFDKSGNERYAEMFNKDIDEELGKCRKGISLNSRPLHITGRLNTSKSQLTVAAWIFLNEVKYIVKYYVCEGKFGL